VRIRGLQRTWIWLLVALLAGCATRARVTTTAVEPPLAQPSAGVPATLKISGAVQSEIEWTEAQVRAMETIQVQTQNRQGETETYTGVAIAALLAQVGPASDATTLVFAASDGYEAQVPLADVLSGDDCIVGFQPQGGFRVVLPGFPGNTQVRDLDAIRVLNDAATELEAPASAEEIPNDGPVTVIDAAGRTIALQRLPRRIVVIGRGPYMGLHLLYTFPEGRTRLIGVESKSAAQSDFIVHVDPSFSDRVVGLAANPNPEQIAALEPDLVLMKSVAMEQMGEALAQVNIPVVYLGLETPQQFFQDVTNLGLLLGNPSRAQEIITFYQSRLDRVVTRVADVPPCERPSVLLLEYSDRGGQVAVEVPALAWMQTFQVQAAGGSPVWTGEAQITDRWTVVNFEQIAAWNPDKIFVVVSYQHDAQAVIDSFKADTHWNKLAAVQNRELYIFPMDHFQWDTPEPRWILGLTWLAWRIHPELFADVDLQGEIYSFFGELYGLDRATVDTGMMPKVLLNVR
jgi:iron complex transport system substrate-binding protein